MTDQQDLGQHTEQDLEQDLEQAKQWQAILRSLTTLSYRSHDLSSYLHDITHTVSQLLKSDWSIVTLNEASRGQVVASNIDLGDTETDFSVHDSISEVVVQSGRPFLIEDVQQQPEATSRMAGYVCYLGVPLRTSQGAVIGTICSFSMQPQHYDAEIIAAVELFAERAATAIDNYRLYQQQQQFNHRLEVEVSKRTEELREAQAKLIEHERLAAIGEFAAMIVHEIRNPLTTVQMGLNYFTKLDLSSAAQARLALAIGESERLANLLQEILFYAKPQILQLSEIDVDAFIQELLILLRSMPEAGGRLIEYIPAASRVWILGDLDKLKQVFINLIRNACEAIETGEIICWSVTETSLDHICISVQNGGAPIPADMLPQLTQPFYSTKATGTGLGLAIVRRIVEAHSGQLLIESSEAKGTIFRVELPKRGAGE
jgi:signal transduction histidine kinase